LRMLWGSDHGWSARKSAANCSRLPTGYRDRARPGSPVGVGINPVMEVIVLRNVFAFLVLLALAGPAAAAQPVPFTASAFGAAQAAGKPILVEVTAPWCPICAKQHPTLSRLEQTPELSDVIVFDVDFDSQKDVLKSFGVQMQSTLIVFSGKTEKDRATGITDPGQIQALLMKAKSG